jgi:hypothetical protein
MKKLNSSKSILWKDGKKASLVMFGLLYVFLFPLIIHAKVLPIDWILDSKVNGVEFYHSIEECNGKKVVFLKFNNTNAYSVKVTWKEVFTTQAEVGAEGFSGKKELVVTPGITMPASCTDIINKKNIIVSSDISPTYIAEIQKFNYKDINVTKE